MQIIHRHVALIALVLTLTLTACMARLLEPVGTQLPTPSTALFASVTTIMTDTAIVTGTNAVTDTVTAAATVTDAAVISETVNSTDVETPEAESAPVDAAATGTITTPVTSADDLPHVTPGATSSAAASPDSTIMPTDASAVMSLTSSAGSAAAFSQGASYDYPISPVDVVSSYYNAVDLADYERAYAYWQPAPLPYVEFAAGYAETASVQLIVQPPTRIEGAAGSLYAAVPTFLIAQHTDGSVHSFAGCITTRKSNVPAPDEADPEWHLYTGQFAEVDNFTSIPAALAAACEP